MEDPLSQLFNTMASSIAARSIATAAASLQGHHYRQLVAEGLDKEAAVAITAATSNALFTGINKLVETILTHPDDLKSLRGVFESWVADAEKMAPEEFIQRVKPALEREFDGTHNASFAVRTMRGELGLPS